MMAALVAIGVSLYTYYKLIISIDIKNEQHVHEDSRNRNRASSFRDISKTKDYENNFKDPEKIRYENYAYIVWNFC